MFWSGSASGVARIGNHGEDELNFLEKLEGVGEMHDADISK